MGMNSQERLAMQTETLGAKKKGGG